MLDLVGNESIQTFLENFELKLPLGKTWLFQGPKGVGKKEFAKHFALKQLNASSSSSSSEMHPDLHLFKPTGPSANYSAESMRQLQNILHLPPTLAPFKIFIITHAHLISNVVANLLLKTLEEPPKDTLIILISSKTLLPTIRSRSLPFCFSKIDQKTIQNYLVENEQIETLIAKKLAKAANGSLQRAKQFLQDDTLKLHECLLNLLDNLDHLDFEQLRHHLGQFQAILDSLVEQFNQNMKEQLELQKERFLPQAIASEMKKIEGEGALYFKDLLDYCFELILQYFRKNPNLLKIDSILIRTHQKMDFNFKTSALLETLFLSLQQTV